MITYLMRFYLKMLILMALETSPCHKMPLSSCFVDFFASEDCNQRFCFMNCLNRELVEVLIEDYHVG